MASEQSEEKQSQKRKKRIGRKVAGAAMAFTAAAGVFVSSLFGSPNDLLADPAANEPPAIVMEIGSDEDAEEEQEVQEEKEEKKGFFARIRAMILHLPLFVRVMIGLPLWALGWGITQAFAALWKLFLGPALARIMTFLILALVLLAVMVILLKLIFPDLPLKEILSRANILIILIGSIGFCLFNFVMERVSQDFADYEFAVRFLEGLVLLLIVVVRMAIRQKRRLKVQTA